MGAKVLITNLKAPWPAGAELRDVVEFVGVDAAPAWTLGKVVPAPDEAKPRFRVAPPAAEAPKPDEAASAQLQDAAASLDAMKAAHADEVAKLRAEITAGGESLQAALDENEALRARLAEADAKLALPGVASIVEVEQQAAAERAATAEGEAAKAPAAKGKAGKA